MNDKKFRRLYREERLWRAQACFGSSYVSQRQTISNTTTCVSSYRSCPEEDWTSWRVLIFERQVQPR